MRTLPDIGRFLYAAPGRVPEAVVQRVAKFGFYIAPGLACTDGRLELLL